MLPARTVRRWYLVHKWSSLVSIGFVLVLCVTGLPLVFRDEIDDWLEPRRLARTAPAAADAAPLDAVVAAAKARLPGLVPQSFFWDEHSPGVIRVSLAPTANALVRDFRWVAVDARSGRVIDDPPTNPAATAFLLRLHKELLGGLAGELILCVAGLCFVTAVVSGVVVYGPFMRRLDFGAFRRRGSARVRWLDVHNLIGIATAAWVLVVGATGVINTLTKPLFALWQAEEFPRWLAPHRGKPPPTVLASADAAVAAVRAALPDNRLFSVVFPYARQGSPRHYLVWTHGASHLSARLFTPALVDAETGELAAVLRLPWYLKTLELSRPLHFGDYGGSPLKLLWVAFDVLTIVVLGSGLYLTVARGRAPAAVSAE